VSDAFYNRMAATASKLLAKFGATVTVSRTTGGSTNPVTGAATPGSTATLTAKGLLTEFSDQMKGANLVGQGTTIQQGDRLLILDNSFEPLMTDRPVVGSQQWNILNIESKKPANVPLVYLVHVRK
jgi:hypothetical protein